MKKFFFISFFIISLFIVGSISILFIYPDRTQNFIVESLNLKTLLNKKVEYFISSKINDDKINVDIESINILKPDWPNITKIELKNINIYSLKQKRKSKINSIELGFTYDKLLTNIFANKDKIQFSYIKFRDLTLNVRIQKDKLLLGPLVKILSLIDENNFQTQSYLKNILDSKIVIGKINLLLINDRNSQKEEILEIKCENVTISKSTHTSRYLDMNCNKGKKNLFSLRANLDKDFNSFSGKIKNVNANFFIGNWLKENFNFLKTSLHYQLNGSYKIKTKKDFSLQNVNFVSDRSILTLKNIKDEKGSKININGVVSWEKNKNLLKFTDVIIDDYLLASGKIDLISQKGTSNFSTQKISIEDTKNYLKEFLNYYHFPHKFNFNKIFNKFRGGNLKNLNIKIKFSLFEEFLVEEIIGSTNFSNTRFDYNDKNFKKLLCTISGNFDFKLKPQKLEDNIFNVNLNATDGFILVNNDIQYKFSKAIVRSKFYKNDFLISKAEFFKNSELEYIFHNVRFSKDTLDIEKAEHIKEKKVQYIISNTTISNMNIKKSTLKIKNNEELSNFIKSKFDIEMIGNIYLDFFLTGNLNNFNFNLKLNSNLKNSYLKIHYLDLIKKKNITSFIKTEISMIEGKIAFLKNTHLSVDDKTYKIGLVQFNKENLNKFLLKNVVIPNINIDKMNISNNGDNLNIRASGKKIDLSNLNKNLKSKTNLNQNVVFDLTADLINLNSEISLVGNLKGEIKGSLFKSIAYGKILLGGAPLLDNGKFEIYSDNKISRLEGIGLIGGAETKINFQKQVNKFPSLIFDTSNGGKLLSALGFTQNIKSGEMKINIKFLNDKYDHYEGRIKSKKFSIINAPGIINSLSILSFSGIRSIIIGQGVFFDKGEVNLEAKNKNFNFDKLYLTSESLGISAKGSLNIEKNSINMRGSVAPIKLISKILSVVPAVGELLTGLKKEGLFAGQFEMKGLINNPEIKINTMSFAPGILRELFSEDWLDNNNFFMNKAID